MPVMKRPHAPPQLPPTAPPLLREHRLYQADWLVRFYGFSLDDIAASTPSGMFDPDVDPRGDEDLHLLVEDRLFWVAVSRHVPIPAGGPSRSPQPTRAYGYSDVIMLIEPGRSTSSIAQTLSAG